MNPTPQPLPAEDDSGSSRRIFLAGAGAATVLGAAAVTVAGAGAADAAPRTEAAASSGASVTSGDAVVAYLRDPAGGEVRVLSGEREVVVHDPELARAMTRHLTRGER
jgi:hypothetical protein